MAQNVGPEFTGAFERTYGPPDMLVWHYGSDHDDRMIHTGCEGEVFALGDGLICNQCGKQKDN